MKYLILLLFPITLLAEELTTNNLIVNGGFDDGTTGWTITGDAQRIGDCCPGGHDLEFGDSGSIEQSFNLINNSITQPMLNNGITLNSSVEVQNGEGGVGSWCPSCGDADSFTVRLQIRDNEDNVLATTTQERYNVTGINGEDYVNSVTYTGIGSNIGNISISGTDSSSPANLGGPNIDNISVTMTYDDTVLSVEQSTMLNTAFENIEEVVEEILFEPIELETFVYEPIEQNEIEMSIPEEALFTELETEEINSGIVNVFSQQPMEVSYGNQETIEEIPAEVEVFEERVENTENYTEENSIIEEETLAENSIEVNEQRPVEEENNRASENSGQELDRGNESESREDEGGVPETTEVATGEQSTQSNQEVSVEVISVSDIAQRVNRVIAEVDRRLVVTSNIVDKQMQNKKIQSYGNVNQKIFEQPILNDIDISYYTNTTYVDIRKIYSGQTYEDRLWTSRQ